MTISESFRLKTSEKVKALARRDRRLTVAFAAILLTVLVGLLTVFRSATGDVDPLQPPTVNVFKAERTDGFDRNESFLGRVEPAQESSVGFELGGEVQAILVEEGQSFGRGASLARLDTSLLRARRAELIAQLNRARAEETLASNTLSRVEVLKQANGAAASELELDAARFDHLAKQAAASAAAAQIAYIDTQLRRSLIRAPFAGTVVRRLADEGEVLAPGSPALTIVASASPRVRVGVPGGFSERAAELGPQTITIGERQYSARFERAVPFRNAETQTADLLYRLPVPIGTVDAGTPARLTFTRDVRENGFRVPMSSLAEGEAGLWSVYALAEKDGSHLVVMKDVELLHQEGDRAFVRGGLEDGELIVANGLHRLVAGMAVVPTTDNRRAAR